LWPSLVYGAGLVTIYVGERLVETGNASTVATVLGAGAVALALGVRLVDVRKASPDRRGPARLLALLCGLGALALLLHFINGPLLAKLAGRTLEQGWPRLSGALSALWPAVLLTGTLPLLFVEQALAGMARAPVLDSRRVRAAFLSGMGLAFTLVFCFSAAYVASERNVKADLSYFRTARPGDATRKLVRALDKPVEITLFFPPANDVAEEVAGYFADVAHESSQLTVKRLDHAVEPARAKDLGVSGNGVVVVSRGSQREQIPISVKLDSARPKLRTLDQEVQKRLLLIARGPRVAYFVQGHEERGFAAVGETDKRATVRLMRDLLEQQGFQIKELGLAQGLGNEVPNDAALVLIMGPRRPLQPAETLSLSVYLERGGRLLVALDPEGGATADVLLGNLSLRYTPVNLANDRIFWARTHQKADRLGIATGSYSAHPAVTVLNQYGVRLPLVLLGAGYLERAPKPTDACTTATGCQASLRDKAPSIDFVIHADAGTWADVDGDFEFTDRKEARKAHELAAAITLRPENGRPEGRALVLADSDALADDIVINRANGVMAMDLVRWLGGDEKVAGTVNNEEDVPVRHTRGQDKVWFYGTVFLAPALVLGAGFVATRRRKKAAAPTEVTR
jgi:hypothetical protein